MRTRVLALLEQNAFRIDFADLLLQLGELFALHNVASPSHESSDCNLDNGGDEMHASSDIPVIRHQVYI